jgi:uncharacterized membrane protein
MFRPWLTRLQNLPLPTDIRESTWLFPTIETVHVFALVLVVGSIITVDLRLLGVSQRDRSFTNLAKEMLPWTWAAFSVAAVAGLLMFTSKAVIYFGNIPFRLKMLCLVLAGCNMIWFHRIEMRQVHRWDHGMPPAGARVAGAASLLLWTLIVGAGRWIGFTT